MNRYESYRFKENLLTEKWKAETGRRAIPKSAWFTERILQLVSNVDTQLLNPYKLAKSLGIEVSFKKLEAETGGLQALLVTMLPEYERKFTIICDPWVGPNKDPDITIQYRIGHELAHSFFYRWDSPPISMIDYWKKNEKLEEFCDSFGDAIVYNARVNNIDLNIPELY